MPPFPFTKVSFWSFSKFNYVRRSSPFSFHKNFILFLGQILLRKVLKSRDVRFSRLQILSTNWGVLVVIGWVPTKLSLRKLQFDFDFKIRWGMFGSSNMSENLASFSIHKSFNLILSQIALRKVGEFRSVSMSRMHFLSTNGGSLLSGKFQKSFFRKISIRFYFEIRWGKYGKSELSHFLARMFYLLTGGYWL